MTTLIYRGIAHTAPAAQTPRGPQPMMYRGAAHDGTSRAIARTDAEMCYRGVAYRQTAQGRRSVQDLLGGHLAMA